MIADYSLYLVTGRDLLPSGKVAKVCNLRQLIIKGASGLPRVLGRGRFISSSIQCYLSLGTEGWGHDRTDSREERGHKRGALYSLCLEGHIHVFSSSASRRLQRKFATDIMYLSS